MDTLIPTNINTTEEELGQELLDDTSYEEQLNATPFEVRQYLWSDAFIADINAVVAKLNLTEAQKLVIKDVAFDTVIGVITPVARRNILADAGISNEIEEEIIFAIDNTIIEKALQTADETRENELDDISEMESFLQDSSNLNDAVTEILTPTKPSNDLGSPNSISNRLTQSSVIAPPSKRDYSLDRAPASAPANTPKVADSYREAVE